MNMNKFDYPILKLYRYNVFG